MSLSLLFLPFESFEEEVIPGEHIPKELENSLEWTEKTDPLWNQRLDQLIM